MKECNKNLIKVLEYVKDLLFLADKGDLEREDGGCGVIYGLIRDSAYKIRTETIKEIEQHKAKGMWDVDEVRPSSRVSPVREKRIVQSP